MRASRPNVPCVLLTCVCIKREGFDSPSKCRGSCILLASQSKAERRQRKQSNRSVCVAGCFFSLLSKNRFTHHYYERNPRRHCPSFHVRTLTNARPAGVDQTHLISPSFTHERLARVDARLGVHPRGLLAERGLDEAVEEHVAEVGARHVGHPGQGLRVGYLTIKKR